VQLSPVDRRIDTVYIHIMYVYVAVLCSTVRVVLKIS